MSYGRTPYYVYKTEVGEEDFFCFVDGALEDADKAILVKYDAMAQFVASCWWRDNKYKPLPDGEIGALIRRGYELRPELIEELETQVEALKREFG